MISSSKKKYLIFCRKIKEIYYKLGKINLKNMLNLIFHYNGIKMNKPNLNYSKSSIKFHSEFPYCNLKI